MTDEQRETKPQTARVPETLVVAATYVRSEMDIELAETLSAAQRNVEDVAKDLIADALRDRA